MTNVLSPIQAPSTSLPELCRSLYRDLPLVQVGQKAFASTTIHPLLGQDLPSSFDLLVGRATLPWATLIQFLNSYAATAALHQVVRNLSLISHAQCGVSSRLCPPSPPVRTLDVRYYSKPLEPTYQLARSSCAVKSGCPLPTSLFARSTCISLRSSESHPSVRKLTHASKPGPPYPTLQLTGSTLWHQFTTSGISLLIIFKFLR